MNESAVYARQGFGNSLRLAPPFGLLLVDFVHGFADPGAFGGGNIGPAIARSVDLLAHARKAGWPVAHTRIVFADDGANANIFSEKVPSLLALTEESRASQIVDELAPLPGNMWCARPSLPPFSAPIWPHGSPRGRCARWRWAAA
jgi:maleamate amidohydrolase